LGEEKGGTELNTFTGEAACAKKDNPDPVWVRQGERRRIMAIILQCPHGHRKEVNHGSNCKTES
jgi:hypothetical protein